MATEATIAEIIRLARGLTPLDKLRIIEQLAPDLEGPLVAGALDEQYERGYERIPEETADLEGLLPHLPLPQEHWE